LKSEADSLLQAALSGKSVPRHARDCSRCRVFDERSSGYVSGEPCSDHPHGSDYQGPFAYEPSDWVLSIIGKRYLGPCGNMYVCTGYDRRIGFWMQSEGSERLANVSERAIGRTFLNA
jgi:hypothetical protein